MFRTTTRSAQSARRSATPRRARRRLALFAVPLTLTALVTPTAASAADTATPQVSAGAPAAARQETSSVSVTVSPFGASSPQMWMPTRADAQLDKGTWSDGRPLVDGQRLMSVSAPKGVDFTVSGQRLDGGRLQGTYTGKGYENPIQFRISENSRNAGFVVSLKGDRSGAQVQDRRVIVNIARVNNWRAIVPNPETIEQQTNQWGLGGYGYVTLGTYPGVTPSNAPDFWITGQVNTQAEQKQPPAIGVDNRQTDAYGVLTGVVRFDGADLMPGQASSAEWKMAAGN